MAKKEAYQSYETQGTPYLQSEDRNALIAQISKDMPRQSPSAGILVSFSGNELHVKYHCYEMHLCDRSRVDGLREESEKLLRDFVRELKKEYKKRAHSVLKMKEMKDRHDYSVQKISLNERFYFVLWQIYELADE